MAHLSKIDPDSHYYVNSVDCPNYDNATLKNKFTGSDDSLRVFHLNIRSVNSNLDELILHLRSLPMEFHVLVLTETWLKGPGDWLDVPGYTAYHSVRTDRREVEFLFW